MSKLIFWHMRWDVVVFVNASLVHVIHPGESLPPTFSYYVVSVFSRRISSPPLERSLATCKVILPCTWRSVFSGYYWSCISHFYMAQWMIICLTVLYTYFPKKWYINNPVESIEVRNDSMFHGIVAESCSKV